MALQVDDVELIKTFKAGDPDAFTHVVSQYREVLFRHALRRLHDPAAAEDAVQETFFRAYRAFDRLRDDSRLGPWLHHIVSNVCVDEAKRRRRVAMTSDRAGGDPTRTRLTEPDLEEQLGLHVDAGPVRRAMGDLPATHQQAFSLRFVDELDYDQIAAVSGTSEQNARARVSRARAAIRAAVRGAAVVPVFLFGWTRRGRSAAALDKVERVDHVHRTGVAVEGATTVSKVATSLAPAVETASAVALHAQHSAPLMTKAAVGIGAIALAAMSAGPERPAPEPAPSVQAAAPAPTTTAPPVAATTTTPAPAPTTTVAAVAPVVAASDTALEDATDAEVTTATAAPTTVATTPATTAPPTTAAPTTVAATTAPPTTAPPTTVPATTAPPTTAAPAPTGGTISVSGLTMSPAGPRLDVSGAVAFTVGDAVHDGSLSGRISIDPERDGSGRQRLDGVVTLSGSFGTIDLRLAGHAVAAAADPDPESSTSITAFSWSGQFRATGTEALAVVTAGSFSGNVSPGSLSLRLAP